MQLLTGRTAGLGALATVAMDVLGVLAHRVRLISPLPPRLIGRWVVTLTQGSIRRDGIDQALPVRHEMAIAAVVHYAVGIAFAWLYLAATSRFGVSPGTGAAAATFGLLTCVFPWLLMFPAMGYGAFGLTGPPGTTLFRSSLVGHLAYGAGIWFGARALHII